MTTDDIGGRQVMANTLVRYHICRGARDVLPTDASKAVDCTKRLSEADIIKMLEY